jgi:hypothetical protein
MELNCYCTGVLGMKQQSCWGGLWFFKRPWILLLEKQRNRQYDIWCLITNAWANRVAIVSSVITKIFNPCKHWMVTIQPSVLYVQWISVYLYLLPVFCRCSSVVPFSFASVLFLFNLLCSIQCLLICLLSVFSDLLLELHSRNFEFWDSWPPLSHGSTRPASPAWSSQEPSDLSGLNQVCSPWLTAECPWSA